MADTSDDDLLDVPHAAERLGYSDEHLRRLVRRGLIGYVRFGKRIMFRPSHLAAFIAEHEVPRDGQ